MKSRLVTAVLALGLGAGFADAQSFVFELDGSRAASLNGQVWIYGGLGSPRVIRGVAEDGRGHLLSAVDCNGGCAMNGALYLDGTLIADFPAPAVDVDVTCEREALVLADKVYRVDLDTGSVTPVWTPTPGVYGAPIAVAGLCGGSFYVAMGNPGGAGGSQLVLVDGTTVTSQFIIGNDLRDVDCTCDGSRVLYASDDSVYDLGSFTPLYTASSNGDVIGGVAIDGDDNWAMTIDNGFQTMGYVLINGQIVHSLLDQYPGDIDTYHPQGSQVLRLGNPPNAPALFAPANPPRLGQVWSPVIDHSVFYPNALFDFVALTAKPVVNIPLAIGTLLCQPPPPAQIFVQPAGQTFSVPMPADCGFADLNLCCQGGSFGMGSLQLTNALDLVLGL